MPPPVLIAEPAMLAALVQSVPDAVNAIVKEFWPGPLTVILKAQEGLNMDLGETAGTVAVRVPDDDAARQLLRELGPLAVSSANISGHDAATTCEQAREMLGDSVAVYLDGGPSRIAVASTIVDFATSGEGRIVRTGVISAEQLHLSAPEDLDA